MTTAARKASFFCIDPNRVQGRDAVRRVCALFARSRQIRVIAYYLKVVDLYLVAEIGVCDPSFIVMPAESGHPEPAPGSTREHNTPNAALGSRLRACERIEDALDRRSASFETAALS